MAGGLRTGAVSQTHCLIPQSYPDFDDTHTDDIGAYIKWLSVFTYWAPLFGIGCGLLTFLPDEYVYIWILSSIPFYVYLYCCYQNYLLFYEQVENAMVAEMTSEDDGQCDHKPEQAQRQDTPFTMQR